MKVCAVLLIGLLLCPAPLAAQPPRPSLLAQAQSETVRLVVDRDYVVVESRMEHPVIFWTGVALLAVGVVAMLGSVWWARDSDLSHEFIDVRLGTDLAPCGTDVETTRLPVAECKTNTGLFWLGSALTAGGGAMMVFGGTQIEKVQPRPMVKAAVRF